MGRAGAPGEGQNECLHRLVSEMTEYEGEKKLHNKVIPTSSLKNCEPLMISYKN